MSARWEGTLDAMLDLYAWWGSENGQDYAKGYASSMSEYAKEQGGDRPLRIADRERLMLLRADPFYVDPDMMTLFEAAAAKFQPEALQDTDLITLCGFVLLPRPMSVRDIRGGWITYRAIGWYPIKVSDWDNPDRVLTGIALSLYHNVHDRDDYTRPEESDIFRQQPLALTHLQPWIFGEGIPTAVSPLNKEETQTVYRQVQCLWRLMAQTIVTKTAMRATSPFRRRWKRQQLDAKPVTVVRLRRPDYHNDDAEHREVAWTHRWLVSGHWRNQPFPSLGIHRQIWINPYVKGPEDRPLEVRKFRVFEFVR